MIVIMIGLNAVRTLLITGANGFVGRSIIDQIARMDSYNLPQELFLVTRQGLDFNLPTNLKYITTVLNYDLTQKWKFDFYVSHVINLAADGSRSSYSASANETFTSIVSNLVSWVSSLQRYPRVFHASSGACSGFRSLSGSNAPHSPKSSFAQNRYEAELELKRASRNLGFELSIGRLFTFSGVHLLRKDQYAISAFIKSAISSKVIRVLGDPNTIRSYLHQDAMANWILKSLICKNPHTSLEIGSSEEVTIRELAEFVAQETSAPISFSAKYQSGDIYVANNRETKNRLEVSEGLHWKLAVKEMIDAERKNYHGHP